MFLILDNNSIFDNQNAGNYHYDETGNLVKDLAEGIDKITWTVYGKIASIEKANGTNIFYTYDPSGNRTSKLVQRSTGDKHYTWYVRDAQGNVMATYTAKGNATELSDLELKLSERHLYGSSRLGILTETVDVDNNNTGPAEVEEITLISYFRGYRQYELFNHLGNVLATVSDKKFGIDNNDDEEIDYFEPEIITASDYYPFGMLMPGRGGSLINGQWQDSGPAILTNFSVDDRTGNQPSEYVALESIEFLDGFESGLNDEFVAYITTSGIGGSYEGEDGLYRYGFNGKENDNETGTQDYGFRIYNPGLGRFLSVDPLTRDFAMFSPFQYGSNNPILNIDLDGEEGLWYIYAKNGVYGETVSKILNGTADGIEASLYRTWDFIRRDAWKGNTWKQTGLFIEELALGMSTVKVYETPRVDAVVQTFIDDVIEGDAYSRSKFAGGLATDITIGILADKGINKLSSLRVFTNTGKTFQSTSIRFTQNSVNDFQKALDALKAGNYDPIDIVKMSDGMYSTVDNTRLLAAQQLGIDIKATAHVFDEALPESMLYRFENPRKVGEYAKTWGEAVKFRTQNQTGKFYETYGEGGAFVQPKINSR